jgi:hypothetical protein
MIFLSCSNKKELLFNSDCISDGDSLIKIRTKNARKLKAAILDSMALMKETPSIGERTEPTIYYSENDSSIIYLIQSDKEFMYRMRFNIELNLIECSDFIIFDE